MQHIPPPITLQKKRKLTKCDLFRACLYFDENILNNKEKSLKRQERRGGGGGDLLFFPFLFYFIKMKDVTNIPSLIRKYCIITRVRAKLATEPLYSCSSGVFCNMGDTDL